MYSRIESQVHRLLETIMTGKQRIQLGVENPAQTKNRAYDVPRHL